MMSSRGTAREIIAVAIGSGQVQTLGLDADKWWKIDLTNETVIDFGGIAHGNVAIHADDLRIWVVHSRDWLLAEYGMPVTQSATGKEPPAGPARETMVKAARRWLTATYPSGVSAGNNNKALSREYTEKTGLSMSDRTMRRARTAR
jgi:hypothetical protein